MTAVFLYKKPLFEVLQYAVKGVERYVKCNDIYVIGDVPDWWQYKSIPVKADSCRFQDVYNKYQRITEIDDDILLMADDIFITKPYKPIQYYNSKLKDRPMKGDRAKVFQNTLSMYPEINNFNLHRPVPVRKKIIKRTMSIFNKPFSHDAFCFGYPTKQAEDCKFRQRFTYDQCKDMDMFSTFNEGDWLIEILEKIYN